MFYIQLSKSGMIDVTNYPAAVRPAPRYCLRANDDPILKPEYYYNSDESQIAFCIEPTRSSPYQDKVDALKNQWNSIPTNVQRGFSTIMYHGFPHNRLGSYGLNASQQRYATALAIQFHSVVEGYADGGPEYNIKVSQARLNEAKTTGVLKDDGGNVRIKAAPGQTNVLRYAIDLFQLAQTKSKLSDNEFVNMTGQSVSTINDSLTQKGTLRVTGTSAIKTMGYRVLSNTSGLTNAHVASGGNGTHIEFHMNPDIVTQRASIVLNMIPTDPMFDDSTIFASERPLGVKQVTVTTFNKALNAFSDGPGREITINLPTDLRVKSVST